jgi:hypothetical protein
VSYASLCARVSAILVAVVVLSLGGESASACSTCHQNPCVLAAPATKCVTEMVPYTVMKTRTRCDYQPVTETVMVRVPETTWVERQRVVCKPVYDTTKVTKQIVVCKPVYDTTYVQQCVTVCKPVTTTCQVTETCMQPVTQLVTVPVGGKCSLCGKVKPACGCATVTKTCYQPVSVVRDVTVTRMVPETQTRQVPVTTCRMVKEVKTIEVPVTTCHMVQEVVTEKCPRTTFRCEPKQVTRMVRVPVCETVPVTCYRPVTHVVACTQEPATVAYATGQTAAAPSAQAPPSPQH